MKWKCIIKPSSIIKYIKNIEIIIVNDGSNDEYVIKKLNSIENHPNIKIVHQENQGPSSARNNGVLNSKGEFVLPLDADDTIQPDYIQLCVNILKNNIICEN